MIVVKYAYGTLNNCNIGTYWDILISKMYSTNPWPNSKTDAYRCSRLQFACRKLSSVLSSTISSSRFSTFFCRLLSFRWWLCVNFGCSGGVLNLAVGLDMQRLGCLPLLVFCLRQSIERKKSLTKRAFKGHRVLNGYATLYWRGGSLVEGN